MKQPKFSQALLNAIDRVHTSATQIYGSLNPQALELAPVKTRGQSSTKSSPPRKLRK